MPHSPLTLSLGLTLSLALVVVAGFTVESAIGFGATVTTLSLSALIAPSIDVLPAYIPLNLALSLYLVIRYFRDIAWKLLIARMAPFVAVGMVAGFAIGARLNRAIGLRIFGGFVVALALSEAYARITTPKPESESADDAPARKESPARTWTRDVVAMTLCGALFGMYATGGPLAVWSVSHHAKNQSVFRATLALLWLVLNSIFFYSLFAAGKVSMATARLTAIFVPALLIGTLIGEWLHHRVSAQRFRTIVFGLLFCVGSILLLRG